MLPTQILVAKENKMTATLTIKEVEVIQAALYCLLDHPEYIKGLPREVVVIEEMDEEMEN